MMESRYARIGKVPANTHRVMFERGSRNSLPMMKIMVIEIIPKSREKGHVRTESLAEI
jgi:hypothetical protein